MKQFSPVAIAFFLLIVPIVSIAQGPISGFLSKRGTHDIAINLASEHFDTYLFGEEEQEQSLSIESASLYYEYGFSDKASLVLTAPYIRIDNINKGLQDGSLHIKFRNNKIEKKNGNWNNITALGINAPLSKYPTNTDNPIGIRAFGFEGRFVSQYNADSGWFLHFQTGLQFKFAESLLTSMPLMLRSGFGAKYYFVEGWLEWYNTFDNGVDQNTSGSTGSDWLRLGGTIYVPVYSGIGIVGGVAQILGGKNIGLSSRYHMGVVYRIEGGK